MSGIVSPEQVEIKEVSIRSERFKDGQSLFVAGEQNDAPVALEMSIYENIYMPYLTGYIYIQDDNDVVRVLNLKGTERLKIVFRSPNTVQFIEKTFIITSIKRSTKVNDQMSHLLLQIVEDHGYFNELNKINKSYNGTAIEVIDKILTDNTNKKLLQRTKESYQDPIRYLVTWQTAYEAISTIMNHTSTDNGMPYFFYSTLFSNDLVLTDLETILQTPSFNKDNPFTYSQANINRNTSFEEQALSISAVNSTYMNNSLSMAKMGGYGSFIDILDTGSGKRIPKHLDMTQEFKNIFEAIPIFNEYEFPIDDKFRVDDKPEKTINDYESNVYTALPAQPYVDGKKGLLPNINSTKNLILKSNFIKYLANNSYKIQIPGYLFAVKNINRSVGSQIDIKILKEGITDNMSSVTDDRKSGDHVILSKRHIFDFVDNTHVVSMRVGRIADRKRIE